MKRPLFTFTLMLLPAVIACGAGPRSKHIVEDVDPYSGMKSLSLDMDTGLCKVPTSADSNPTRVKLIVTALANPDGPADYALFVDMTGGHMVHPDKHGSLEALVDGTREGVPLLASKSKWSERRAFTGRVLRESIPFDVGGEFLGRLADAKEFQFRVHAADTTLERCAGAKELRGLHEFLGRAAAL